MNTPTIITPITIAREKCFDCVRYRPGSKGTWNCEFLLQPVFLETKSEKGIVSRSAICRAFLAYAPKVSWGRKYLELSERHAWPLWMRGIVRFIARRQRRIHVVSELERAASQIVGKVEPVKKKKNGGIK